MNSRKLLTLGALCVLLGATGPPAQGQVTSWQHVYQVFGSCEPNDSGPPILHIATGADGRVYFSDPGNFFRSLDDGVNWEKPAFQEVHIEGIVPMMADTVIVGLYGADGGVFVATEEGDAWVKTSVGINISGLAAVDSRDLVFAIAADSGLFVSEDRGSTWRLTLDSKEVRGLSVGPDGTTFLLTDGLHSSTNGLDWTAHPSTRFPFPTSNPGILLSADTEGVYRSEDDGHTWDMVLTSNGPALRRNREGSVIAITKDGLVFTSLDNGLNWSETISSPPAQCGARSTVAIDDRGYLWLGNTVGGVFRSSHSTHVGLATHDVSRVEPAAIEAYPNPASQIMTIALDVKKPSMMRLSAVDLIGREVALIRSGFQSLGRSESSWEPIGLPPGVYFIRIDANGTTATHLVTLIR